MEEGSCHKIQRLILFNIVKFKGYHQLVASGVICPEGIDTNIVRVAHLNFFLVNNPNQNAYRFGRAIRKTSPDLIPIPGSVTIPASHVYIDLNRGAGDFSNQHGRLNG